MESCPVHQRKLRFSLTFLQGIAVHVTGDAHAVVAARRGFVAKHAAVGPAWNPRGLPVAQFRLGASGAGALPRC